MELNYSIKREPYKLKSKIFNCQCPPPLGKVLEGCICPKCRYKAPGDAPPRTGPGTIYNRLAQMQQLAIDARDNKQKSIPKYPGYSITYDGRLYNSTNRRIKVTEDFKGRRHAVIVINRADKVFGRVLIKDLIKLAWN